MRPEIRIVFGGEYRKRRGHLAEPKKCSLCLKKRRRAVSENPSSFIQQRRRPDQYPVRVEEKKDFARRWEVRRIGPMSKDGRALTIAAWIVAATVIGFVFKSAEPFFPLFLALFYFIWPPPGPADEDQVLLPDIAL